MVGAGLPKYWREAASLILVASNRKPPAKNIQLGNFDVLMLKRGKGSSFLPNAYAYPGGVTSEADFDARNWTKVFSRVRGFTDLAKLLKPFKVPGVRPPIMTNRECGETILAPEIAFRLCAIRETFEETGVLLVCNNSDLDLTKPVERLQGRVPPMASTDTDFDDQDWRNRVSSDASQLQELCLTFNVVPNIWALYEWSNWLTPVFFKVTQPTEKPRRFDTMFYVCSLNAVPDKSELYTDEIAKTDWKSPKEWFKLAQDRTVTFVGPQVKETSHLAFFNSETDLMRHVYQREPLGCLCWFPVNYRCTDGLIATLPGDELYPDNPDYEGTKDLLELDMDVKTACLQARRLHRLIFGSVYSYINVDVPCGYVQGTFAEKSFPKDFNISKL